MPTAREIATNIVADIVRDFTDRRGLRQEWEEIDADVRAQIKETWTQIVERHLTADTVVMPPGVKGLLLDMKQNPNRVRNILDETWNGEE